MIRINLLAVPKARKVKKAAQAQFELVIAALAVGGVFMICLFIMFSLNGKVNRLTGEKNNKTQELKVLEAKVKEVDNFEKNKEELEERNRIIEKLRKNQGAPVRLLDELSKSLDPLKIWLVSLSEKGGVVNLEGRAITNSDIVEFITNLKNTEFFGEVLLIESRQSVEKNIPIYSFKLRANMLV